MLKTQCLEISKLKEGYCVLGYYVYGDAITVDMEIQKKNTLKGVKQR